MKFKSLGYPLSIIAIAAVYFCAAQLGLSLATAHVNVSPVWPPTGIAIASLLIFGPRYWPAIFLGAFAANLSTNVGPFASAGIAVGNTLEAVVACLILAKLDGIKRALDSLAAVFNFIFVAAVGAPMISATLGNLVLCSTAAAPWANYWSLWLTWWLGDAVGALVFAPFILAWANPNKRPIARILEAILLVLLLFFAAMIVFNGWFPGHEKNYPLGHLGLPFLVWAALRFEQRLLNTAILLLSVVAIWGTAHGFGPFVTQDANKSLLLVQAFVGSSSLTALILFAVISERKSAQDENLSLAAEVTHQRERLSKVVAHVPGVVWEAWGRPDHKNQRIDFVSEHVEKMLGYSQEEWLGTPNFWLTIVHPDDKERAAHEAAEIFNSRLGGISRFRWLDKDGSAIWVEAQSVVVCDEKGDAVGMRGVTMDITSAVLAEQERARLLDSERNARAAAEKASRLKDEFLATVSHELRTPLNAIVGWSRLLSGNQLGPVELQHAVEVIERSARVQKQIIEDMLDVSRIITGKLRLGLTPVRVFEVIQEAIDAVKPAAAAKEIEIQTEIDESPVIVNADADRLQQVAWNLLSNAVKFTPAGGQISIKVARRNGDAEIVVTDNGPGIDPEFLPHAFERFTQADGSSTRRHGGIGLGLAIVRHLVELHGGSVTAENRSDGSGAAFTVKLPSLDP
jgi:PAS domain S-box-containing protein